nr:MAG: MC014R [Molluscum contagiosum virus]
MGRTCRVTCVIRCGSTCFSLWASPGLGTSGTRLRVRALARGKAQPPRALAAAGRRCGRQCRSPRLQTRRLLQREKCAMGRERRFCLWSGRHPKAPPGGRARVRAHPGSDRVAAWPTSRKHS